MQGFTATGVRCVAGNDAGLPYTGFGHLWGELSTMVDGGMFPLQAIEAATSNAAQALHLTDTIGSIQPGKQADLIAVDGDPTRDRDPGSKLNTLVPEKTKMTTAVLRETLDPERWSSPDDFL